jgi:prepilin-type N-terminal cleavage/methylation domain-containing protein
MKTKRLNSNKGFTIIELMISLSILSVILVTASALLVRIGSIYTKGVNAANLQNVNRNIATDLTSGIQFGGKPSGCAVDAGFTCSTTAPLTSNGETIYVYCIGTTRYSYVVGRELGLDVQGGNVTTPHILWRDSMNSSGGGCTPLDISVAGIPSDGLTVAGSGYDMISDHMRLTRFWIKETGVNTYIYDIDAWVAYGDSDVVVADPRGGPAGSVVCQGGPGSQYCSIAKISQTIARRVK